MVAESLHLMLHDVVAWGLIHGFHVGHSELEITHSQYANDTILFLKVDKEELSLVVAILLWFQVCLVMKSSFSKSEMMGVNLDFSTCRELAAILGCKVFRFYTSYLGLPLAIGNLERSPGTK